jgi:hypothetical protein
MMSWRARAQAHRPLGVGDEGAEFQTGADAAKARQIGAVVFRAAEVDRHRGADAQITGGVVAGIGVEHAVEGDEPHFVVVHFHEVLVAQRNRGNDGEPIIIVAFVARRHGGAEAEADIGDVLRQQIDGGLQAVGHTGREIIEVLGRGRRSAGNKRAQNDSGARGNFNHRQINPVR